MTPEAEVEPPVAIVADAHFSERTPGPINAFKRFLEGCPRLFPTLVLLGDLFDFWIGIRGKFPAHQATVIQAIRDARKGGARIIYVEGNRDYAISRIDEGRLFDHLFPAEGVLSVAGRRYLVTHGDRINRRDWRYRVWRRSSRLFLAPLALRLLPSERIIGLASRLEFSLKGANPAGRRGFPENLCLAYARRRLETGLDAVIAGHFHTERVVSENGPGGRGLFYAVPSWMDSQRILLMDEEGSPAYRQIEV